MEVQGDVVVFGGIGREQEEIKIGGNNATCIYEELRGYWI